MLRAIPWGRRRDRLTDLGVFVAAAASAGFCLSPISGVLAMFWAMLVLIIIRYDVAFFIIPDAASSAVAALGLLHAGLSAFNADGILLSAIEAVAWAGLNGVFALVLFWLVGWAFAVRTGRDGLGFGDVKLAGALAVWLDVPDQIIALEIAALSAIAVVLASARRVGKTGGMAIPFGAFMAPAAWLVFVAGPGTRRMLGYE